MLLTDTVNEPQYDTDCDKNDDTVPEQKSAQFW
jgi:hypothetical protein